MYSTLTDEELIALVKVNDELALKALFDRYYRSLCQLSSIYTKDYTVAEEIVANVFMKLWDGRSDATILNVKSYLFVAAKNASLNHIQKKRDPVDSIEDVDFKEQLFADKKTPFHIISGRESYKKILHTIDSLPVSQREVLLMSHVEDLNKHEISKILGITVRTVETTLYQSIKKIRSLLKDSFNFSS